MLRDFWVVLAAAIVITGLAMQDGAIVALGLGVAIVCYGAKLWARYALHRLRYERLAPEDRAFAGEHVALTLRATNEKPLPLPWLDIRERFPESMLPGADAAEFRLAGRSGVLQTDWRTSVGGYRRVSRSYQLHCPARGVYEIGPGRLRSGDLFGLFTDEREEARRTRIIVYPPTVPVGDLALPARRPYGDAPRGIRIFEDPSRVAGLRDYLPGDSLRRIDWNATARLGVLQTRVYDPASAQHLLICLNTQTVEPSWSGYVPDMLERSIALAASIARDAYDRRFSAGLLANGSMPDADRAIRVAPGRRPEHFLRILEALAVITPYVPEGLAAMLDREEHRIGIGTTIAVVTGIMPDALAATLQRLHRRRHAVIVISVTGETWPDLLGRIDVRDASSFDFGWAEALP